MLFVFRLSLVFLSCVVPGSSLRRHSQQQKSNQTGFDEWEDAWRAKKVECKCRLWQKECRDKKECIDFCNLDMAEPNGPDRINKCGRGYLDNNMCLCEGKNRYLTKLAAHIRDECKGKCASGDVCFINTRYFNEEEQREKGEHYILKEKLPYPEGKSGMWCASGRWEPNPIYVSNGFEPMRLADAKFTPVDWTWDGKGLPGGGGGGTLHRRRQR